MLNLVVREENTGLWKINPITTRWINFTSQRGLTSLRIFEFVYGTYNWNDEKNLPPQKKYVHASVPVLAASLINLLAPEFDI
jgi:hypothetical protein